MLSFAKQVRVRTIQTDPVYNWREVQKRSGELDATWRSFQAMSLSMAARRKPSTQVGAELATSTQAPEPRRAEAQSSSYPEAKKVHFDLDVSIEKMITGLRINSSRSQAEETVRVNCKDPGNKPRLRGLDWQSLVTSNTAQRIGSECARVANSCRGALSWVGPPVKGSVERDTKKTREIDWRKREIVNTTKTQHNPLHCRA